MFYRNGFLALLALCWAGPGHSSTIFDARADFLAQLVSYSTYTFEVADGFPVARAPIAGFGAGQVQASSNSGPATVRIYEPPAFNQVLTGRSDDPSTGFTDFDFPLHLTFKDAQFAVGFDNVDLTPAGTEIAILTFSFDGGTPSQTFTLEDDDDDVTTPTFFGIITPDPIRRLTVRSQTDLSFDDMRGNAIDDLTLGIPVPEPGSAMVLAVLLAPWAAGQRRMS